MRVPIILFWIIPAVGSDIVNDLSHHKNLTEAGSLIVSLFLTALFMAIWVYSGRLARRAGAEDQHMTLLSAFAKRGWYAVVDGKDYLMLPAENLKQEVQAQGGKEPNRFVTAGQKP